MLKISRNAPCPCGSGKKYKKCCLPRHGAMAREIPENPQTLETDLDQLSNSVVDLIQSGRLDQAEQACRRLLAEYPDVVDGLMRFAQVYKAKGDKPKAVEYFRKASAFMQSAPGYDEEMIRSFLDEADALEASMNAREVNGGPEIR